MGLITKKDPPVSGSGYFSIFCKDHIWTGRNMDGVSITQSLLEELTLDTCVLSKFVLSRTEIHGGWFADTHFDTLIATGEWRDIKMQETSFDKSEFRFSKWLDVELEGTVIFTGCTFINVDFQRCYFKDVRFAGCTFENCTFNKCTFDGRYSATRRQINCRVEFVSCSVHGCVWTECVFKKRTNAAGKVADVRAHMHSTSFIKCTGRNNKLVRCSKGGFNRVSGQSIEARAQGKDPELAKTQEMPVVREPEPASAAAAQAALIPANWRGYWDDADDSSDTQPNDASSSADAEEEDEDEDEYALMAGYCGYGACDYDSGYYSRGVKRVGKKWAFVFSTAGVRPRKTTNAGS